MNLPRAPLDSANSLIFQVIFPQVNLFEHKDINPTTMKENDPLTCCESLLIPFNVRIVVAFTKSQWTQLVTIEVYLQGFGNGLDDVTISPTQNLSAFDSRKDKLIKKETMTELEDNIEDLIH